MRRKIDKLCEALSADRSKTIRWILERGIESGQVVMLLRRGQGRGLAGRVVGYHAAQFRAAAADRAMKSAPGDLAAEIKALRTQEEAQSRGEAIADHIALQKAHPRQ